MQYISLFSGIGAFEKALTNLGVPYEVLAFSEIDPFATASYCVLHGVHETRNLGDVTKVDTKKLPKDPDLLTYGFPCQDISVAGQQRGLFHTDGTRTRSGLFFDALRVIEETQPKVAIAENVKNLVGKKFNAQFQVVLSSLEAAGYNNYWQVLNAKDYGIPQNRERVFIVSIRKDIDQGVFKFPEGLPLELRLGDLLDDEVADKYYLDGKYESIHQVNDNYAMLHGGVIGKMHDVSRRVYNQSSIAPTIHTCAGGNLQPKVAVAMRGRYNDAGKVEQRLELSGQEIAHTLTTVQKDSMVASVIPGTDPQEIRVRKFTPAECWRLMGFDNSDFTKVAKINSDTQLYKQAGNSIVVQVAEHLLSAVFKAQNVLSEPEEDDTWML